MSPIFIRAVAFLLACLSIGSAIAQAGDPGPVAVPLRNGRVLTGEVDATTDEQLLRLRMATPRIVLVSTVRWDSVVRVDGTDRRWSRDELCEWARKERARLTESERDGKRVQQTSAVETPPRVDPAEFASPPQFPPALHAPAMMPLVPLGARPVVIPVEIASLAVEVRPANWDADAEDDGLEVRLFPRTVGGILVPATGSVRVRLAGRRMMAADSRDLTLERSIRTELGHWSVPVRMCDYDDWGAVVRLPWQRVDPQCEPGFSVETEAIVEFGANGGRTFRAATGVPLRARGDAAVSR